MNVDLFRINKIDLSTTVASFATCFDIWQSIARFCFAFHEKTLISRKKFVSLIFSCLPSSSSSYLIIINIHEDLHGNANFNSITGAPLLIIIPEKARDTSLHMVKLLRKGARLKSSWYLTLSAAIKTIWHRQIVHCHDKK